MLTRFRNMTVSFQLLLTQENDSDSDFEDFDSDEESDSELGSNVILHIRMSLTSV